MKKVYKSKSDGSGAMISIRQRHYRAQKSKSYQDAFMQREIRYIGVRWSYRKHYVVRFNQNVS